MNVHHIPSTLLPALLLFLACSLPESIAPVQWKMHVEIPVINQRIPVGDLLKKGAYGNFKVRFDDSIVFGDTISITKTDSLKYDFEQILESSKTTEIKKTLGPCQIDHLPPVDVVFDVSSSLPDDGKTGEQLATKTTISMSKKGYVLKGVHSVTIDDSSPLLAVSVTNLSRSIEFGNVVVAILDDQDVVGILHTSALSAQQSKTIPISIAGKQLQIPMALSVCATLLPGSSIYPLDLLRITFSLNKQIISDAVIKDSLIDFSTTISRDIVIADSFRIDRLEFGRTSLGCEISCPAFLKMGINGSFVNCRKQQRAGSDFTIENFVADTLFDYPGSMRHFMNIPLQEMCLYPSWDPDLRQSSLSCFFRMYLIPDGRLVHFSKNDTLSMKLLPLRLPVIRVDGWLGRKFGHASSAKFKAGLAGKTSIVNTLQRSLRFQSARLRCDFDPGLPSGSSVDSLLLTVMMKDYHKQVDSAVMFRTLTGITSHTRQSITMDFTGVFNLWPDTILFDTRLQLPSGTQISFSNPNSGRDGSMPFLKFNPGITWTVTVPLCWQVTDTIRIEPELTRLSIDSGQVKWVSVLRDARVQIFMNVVNRTNIGIIAHALGAPAIHEAALMAFPDSLVGHEGFEKQLPDQVSALFDNSGLTIAPRNDSNTAVLQLDEQGTAAFLSHGHYSIRWFLLIPSKDADALRSSDYCSLRATGVIDGVGQTDTLLNSN